MLIYKFDGSLNGLLCCVFKSFTDKEIPDVLSSDKNTQLSLTDREIKIITVDGQCERIAKAIEKYSGLGGLYDIRYAFKSGAKNKDKIIFDYHTPNQQIVLGTTLVERISSDRME